MMAGMERKQVIIGDWKGTTYGMSGARADWQLSLYQSGSYSLNVHSSRFPRSENGTWTLVENDAALQFMPEGGEPSRWVIHDVTKLEFSSTLLVLRRLVMASRNLPILLYRVHPLPGPPSPLDAHGFASSPFPEARD